ncbi:MULTISPECIES: division/cell wall cluster transcriptional repressor MraZ [unclassified Iodobacter]|uniref:division/cell wall cluster transcriptional repressor MraZ n=1 Tax=unclassified Iodobacter TaxID=235634 RepID=UPI0025DBE837|nr:MULTISPECIES: division/cell wall cluster transcriptional repressor MraZ [unclassified Iodobacter]MDW5414972.1 division/cell wall cluster transcriptional repressor MraZ [Iodobacter sp. CM08]
MFGGVASVNLDSKGRLAIPARHRDVLGTHCANRLVITAEPSGCLLLYPEPDWLPVRDQLNRLSGAQMPIRRFIVGHAEEIEPDSAGRILIPPRLRQLAGLDKEVALVGMGNKFELWDEARWAAQIQAVMEINPDDLANQMQGIVL